MFLKELRLTGLRNLVDSQLVFSNGLNYFFGQNGSGKSSVLEAIHYLGYGRSFRTSSHSPVINSMKSEFNIFGLVANQDGQTSVGLKRTRAREVLLKVDGAQSQLSKLVALFPILMFSPQTIDCVFSRSLFRRRLLDWGLFHVEHGYAELVSTFSKIVKHRNAMLRSVKIKGLNSIPRNELEYWDSEYARHAYLISQRREAYLNLLGQHLTETLPEVLRKEEMTLCYSEHWESSDKIVEALSGNLERDIRYGYTSVGPHRADLRILKKKKIATEYLSRGEQRMLMAGIILAQQSSLKAAKSVNPIILIDDLNAELDAYNQDDLITRLRDSGSQIFITAISPDGIRKELSQEYKVFHVEHGHVKEEIH